MTATDELRRLLDERGVEWRERVWGGKHSVTTFWHARGVRWHYRENRFGELRLHADGLSPEQAIDATLGRGTLSASQVSGAIYAHSIHADCADADWQAIADELNNTLGSCNCTNSEQKETCYNASYRLDESRFHCSECGFGCWVKDVADGRDKLPRYCPNCGRRIVDPTTNDVDAEVTDG